MEYFRNAQVVRLRSLDNKYLCATGSEAILVYVKQEDNAFLESYRDVYDLSVRDTQWFVEFVPNSDSVIRLRSQYGNYLTASDQLSPYGMTGGKVRLSRPSTLDSSLELEPVMEGIRFKFRTHYDTFLCANSGHTPQCESITHDLLHDTNILWDIEVLKSKVEASASNIDDKALEEGSATERRLETGEGSSVPKSPPGDSGLIRERDTVRYRRQFWKLKKLLLDDSGRKDVFVKGGSGTAALVREVCSDVRQHFGTIAWISIPRRKDPELIRDEIFVQLIFERVAYSHNFDRNPWIVEDHEFSLQQKERCLIVVDNLEDTRTWAKFEQILRIVKTCRVIFIARRQMGSSYNQMDRYGREVETYKLEDLSYVPRAHPLMDFLKERFPASPSGAGQLIVKTCERLPTAIIFVLRDQKELWLPSSFELIRDEWEARIPSDKLRHELDVIQQLSRALILNRGHEFEHIEQVMEILHKAKGKDLLCFLYLSIFPEDSLISCNRVSRLWAAEGLLSHLEKSKHPLDLWRECIQPVEKRSDGELSTFQVDKRVLQIIVLLFDLRDIVTIKSKGSTNWRETVRYLRVKGTFKTLNEDTSSPLSSIFVLDVSSNEEKTTSETSPLETSETPLFPLENFKVLDLKGAPFQFVQDALKSLFELPDPSLRYLSLSNTSIKVIPDSIGTLTHLEFLVLKHSLVTELPPEVGSLKRIRHILIYHHEKDPLMESYNLIGFKASCKVGQFLRLEKLCFVEASKRMLKDLGKLTKLRRLGITKLRATHGKLLCPSLEKLGGLKSLNVHAFEEDEIIDLRDLSSLPKHLKRLYLHGRLEKLPDWISSLSDLTRITLRWSQLEEDPLATLGRLPKLVELELRRAYEGRQLDFKNDQFPELKILVLDKLEGLRSMSLEKGTMPCLENLTISRCQWLERIPSGIEHMSTIRRLECSDMSSEFYKNVRADHEKDHYQSFKNIPEVYFTQRRAGHWETHQVESTDEARSPSGFFSNLFK